MKACSDFNKEIPLEVLIIEIFMWQEVRGTFFSTAETCGTGTEQVQLQLLAVATVFGLSSSASLVYLKLDVIPALKKPSRTNVLACKSILPQVALDAP